MLKSTFLHIRGVSALKESKLWDQGVFDWDTLFNSPQAPKSPTWRQESLQAYANQDTSYFAKKLPNGEHWRIAATFPETTMFLDIETTGYEPGSSVTIIGWSMGQEFKVWVNHRDDPTEFLRDLSRAKCLVTFNGRCFDARFIARHFQDDYILSLPHADLRFLCRRLFLKGGLKEIERQLGWSRESGVSDGLEAVILWEKYRSRRQKDSVRKQALRNLIHYNYEDVIVLKRLFNECLKRLLSHETLIAKAKPFPLEVAQDFSDPQAFPFSLDLI
ncbi:MAG: ribonuclease H-like domain-containing protein [Deltaproteobacteria bacterium]|jgi:uncharacterized protein YprB with RNaseH-like and TPR domain|nr:ribonuclease H-like domain-containing protein [Deltaproteobacteria bacterium]